MSADTLIIHSMYVQMYCRYRCILKSIDNFIILLITWSLYHGLNQVFSTTSKLLLPTRKILEVLKSTEQDTKKTVLCIVWENIPQSDWGYLIEDVIIEDCLTNML